MREMKLRKAGVAMGGWDWEETPPVVFVLDWEVETGSVGGEDMVARESPIAARDYWMKPIEREAMETRAWFGLFGLGLIWEGMKKL